MHHQGFEGESMNMWTIWTITLVILLDYMQT